jgi:hypothetical protein
VTRALVLAWCLSSGCALAHEVSVDANRDTGGVTSVTLPCVGMGTSGTRRDCGWQASGAMACAPGSTLRVGCSRSCGVGSCTGDSMIRVCDTAPCIADRAIAQNDDESCGGGEDFVCSFIGDVICPASGRIYVLTAPFTDGTPYTCDVEIR